MQGFTPILHLKDRHWKWCRFHNLFDHLPLIILLFTLLLDWLLGQLSLHLLINIILNVVIGSILISYHNLLLLFFHFGVISTLLLFLMTFIWIMMFAFWRLFLLNHVQEFLMFGCVSAQFLMGDMFGVLIVVSLGMQESKCTLTRIVRLNMRKQCKN